MKTVVMFDFNFMDDDGSVMGYHLWDTVEHDADECTLDLILKALMEITKTDAYRKFTLNRTAPILTIRLHPS